jgi:protocatechuate 3,4-dioxygenase beta subunit
MTRDGLPRYERVPAGVHPPLLSPAYRSTARRAPMRPAVQLQQLLTEVTGPLLGEGRVSPDDADLTGQHDVEPQGQRILVRGRVIDSDGHPVPATLVEIWQAKPPDGTGTPATSGRRRWTRVSAVWAAR